MQCTENPLLFGDGFYIFVCLPCNFGEEYIKRLDVEWYVANNTLPFGKNNGGSRYFV